MEVFETRLRMLRMLWDTEVPLPGYRSKRHSLGLFRWHGLQGWQGVPGMQLS